MEGSEIVTVRFSREALDLLIKMWNESLIYKEAEPTASPSYRERIKVYEKEFAPGEVTLNFSIALEATGVAI